MSSYFARGTDAKKGEVKRKFDDLNSGDTNQAPTKKVKAEKKKITSFFAPKLNKTLGDKNDNQDVKSQKVELDPESRLASACDADKSAKVKDNSTKSVSVMDNSSMSVRAKDNSSAVTAWVSMFNKAAVAAPVCAGHSEPCVRRKVKKKQISVPLEIFGMAPFHLPRQFLFIEFSFPSFSR